MTNPVSELLTPQDVALGVPAANADALLIAAADLIARRHRVPARSIHEALAERERLGSTALGHGIALPHARIATLARPLGAFITTAEPIDFKAPDRRPVQCFLVLLVPAEATEHHLAILGCAARQFGDPGFRARLRAARDAAAIAEVFGYLPP
jgi:PTS system nitrogen regulatory IIA component